MKQAIIALMGSLLLDLPLAVHAADVQLTDISDGKTTLIGRLDKPLGTVVTLEGQLISEPKAVNGRVTAAFRASRVDGQLLRKAQVIGLQFRASRGVPPLRANQLVKLSGYEFAAFIGTPDAAREAMGSDGSAVDWKFASVVQVIELL